MESKNKKLRSGYTTGACAAAAAKAAALYLLRISDCGLRNEGRPERIEIPFPDGHRVTFAVHASDYNADRKSAWASVIKDAGDDPDVTNGAEIRAEVTLIADFGLRIAELNPGIEICGGEGIGRVTKPGLAVPVGEPAINLVPRRMIREAVQETLSDCCSSSRAVNPQSAIELSLSATPSPAWERDRVRDVRNSQLKVTISVPTGEELAKKTLNHRLGIVGGISILGTTGIVKPLSEAAWTATISSSFDVAKALGREEVVLSTGRTSEKAHQKKYGLPEECYAMMGDYTEFSLQDAEKHGFQKIHLCAQWAKMIKIAMATPQTHVRHGAIEAKDAVAFLRTLGVDISGQKEFNSVREVFDFIQSAIRNPQSAISAVCLAAKKYAERITSGLPVVVHLVSYEGRIIAASE